MTGGEETREDMNGSAKATDDAKTEPGEGAPAAGGRLPDAIRFPLVLGVVGAISALALAFMYALTQKQIESAKQAKLEEAMRSVFGERYEKTVPKGKGESACLVALDAGGATLGYAATVACPGSYNGGSPITLVVIMDPGLARVLGARVVASEETPGLGEQIKEPPSAQSIFGAAMGRPPRRRLVLAEGGALVGSVEEKDGSYVFAGADGRERALSRGEVVEVTDAPFPAAFMDQFTGRAPDEAKLADEGGKVDAITGATISSRAVGAGVALAVERLRKALGGEGE